MSHQIKRQPLYNKNFNQSQWQPNLQSDVKTMFTL